MTLSFDIESWIWYGVVMWMGLSRFVSRRLVLRSFRAFQLDDYIMIIALCFYTTLIVTINIVAVTASNLLPDDYDVANMAQDDINERIYGSKLVLVVEECQCCVIWAAKACLLTMYLRFTVLAKENLAIKILAGYVAGSFILMEILYLGVWCRPFNEYWAVPSSSTQCTAATNHLITNAALNLTSDLAMLLVGLPIFIRIQIPLRQRIPLVGLFSLGVFVIVAAILNKIYSFSNPFGSEWVFWYVRESSTALIVANMPFVWALYRQLLGCSSHGKTLSGKGVSEATSSPIRKRHHSINPLESLNGHSARSSVDHTAENGMPNNTMTAAEWLRDDYMMSTAPDRKTPQTEVNQYTHPALYYNLAKQGQA